MLAKSTSSEQHFLQTENPSQKLKFSNLDGMKKRLNGATSYWVKAEISEVLRQKENLLE